MVKKAVSGRKQRNDGDAIAKTGAKKQRRAFPIVTLEEALKIPTAIKAKNNGHPWESNLVAKACGMTHMTNKFFYRSTAARDYGLTIGTRDTPKIELTELGRDIVF